MSRRRDPPAAAQDVSKSSVQSRLRQTPVEEASVSRSNIQQSQATPTYSKDRFERDSKPFSSKSEIKTDSKSELQKDSSKTDFRSVLSNRQKSFESNSISKTTAQSSTDSKPSWARKETSMDVKKSETREVKPTPSGKPDFRSVLKTRQADNETKPPAGTNRDNTSNVQSKADFRSVLAKIKHAGEEKKNGMATSGPTKLTSEKPPSKPKTNDVSNIKAKFESPSSNIKTKKFETPAQDDFRSVQLKPSKPHSTEQPVSTLLDTNITRKPGDWRTGRDRDRPAVKPTTELPATRKQPEASNTFGNRPKLTDDSKFSDSSQLSDSAISSVFSKLSEFSDLSDSSPPASEASLPLEVPESRSRRRLERLRGDKEGGKKPEDEAPSIQKRLEDQSVTYGGQAVLQCTVRGVPEPRINWSVNNKAIKVRKLVSNDCCVLHNSSHRG